MKKQLSNITRLLLLSGVAVIMSTSCMFLPQKEVEEEPSVSTEEKVNDDGTTVLTKDGRTLVWQDEFNYTGVPDVTKWKYQTGANGWGNNELQNYLDNSTEAKTAVVEDGVLKIKAFKENGKWVSARLNSKQSWKYGFIEGRLKITDRKGAWPAFWMMPQNSVYGGWPDSGEIDIMENAPNVGNHKVFSTLHATGHNGGSGAGIGSKFYDSNLSSEWHTFGVMWTEEKITAYYDDVAVGSYGNDGSGPVNWPYDKEFYIILNLAIGGKLGGDAYVNSLNGQAEFLVDYVRVYQ